MIDQRKNNLLPIDFESSDDIGLPENFESAGNDNLGGFGLDQFGPQ